MNEKLAAFGCAFEIVDFLPLGYEVWNVAPEIIPGYIPLCRLKAVQPFPGGKEIETDTLRAIRIEDAKKYLEKDPEHPCCGKLLVEGVKRYIEKVEKSKRIIPHVTLTAEFIVKTDRPANFAEYGAEIGGFAAVIDGKDIPFDFNAFGYHVREMGENSYLFQYESGKGVAFSEFQLSEDFFEEYERAGLPAEKLTAEKMASMSALTEFHFAPSEDFDGKIVGFEVRIFTFSDGNREYPVPANSGIFDDTIQDILK